MSPEGRTRPTAGAPRTSALIGCCTCPIVLANCPSAGVRSGMSKLAVIAATKVLARDEPAIKVNACCPGYCKTDSEPDHGSTHHHVIRVALSHAYLMRSVFAQRDAHSTGWCTQRSSPRHRQQAVVPYGRFLREREAVDLVNVSRVP